MISNFLYQSSNFIFYSFFVFFFLLYFLGKKFFNISNFSTKYFIYFMFFHFFKKKFKSSFIPYKKFLFSFICILFLFYEQNTVLSLSILRIVGYWSLLFFSLFQLLYFELFYLFWSLFWFMPFINQSLGLPQTLG